MLKNLIPNTLGFHARTQRKDQEIASFFSMERNWNCVICCSLSLDLFHWVQLLTAQRKGKFISPRSHFYFPDWVLSVFYDSILAKYVPSSDFFLLISYHMWTHICHLRFFCQWFVRPWLDMKLQIYFSEGEVWNLCLHKFFMLMWRWNVVEWWLILANSKNDSNCSCISHAGSNVKSLWPHRSNCRWKFKLAIWNLTRGQLSLFLC